MCRQMTNILKWVGIGLAFWLAAMECWKMCAKMGGAKNRRNRCRLKQDAGRAVRMVGDVINDVECMFKR